MASEEIEVTIEIRCTRLPGLQWGEQGPYYLGIQKGKEIVATAPADLERIVFRPTFRVRRHTDGSANFLGPFAQGPRAERFIYLNWVTVKQGVPVRQYGRVKLHLSHITWADVEKAGAKGRAIEVTLPLTNTKKGGPVFASVRADACKWGL